MLEVLVGFKRMGSQQRFKRSEILEVSRALRRIVEILAGF